MNRFFILTVSSVVLAVGTLAFASEKNTRCDPTASTWMTRDAVKAKANEKGYDVRRIKQKGGCYEIYAIGKNGFRVELYLNPVTGKFTRNKNKS